VSFKVDLMNNGYCLKIDIAKLPLLFNGAYQNIKPNGVDSVVYGT